MYTLLRQFLIALLGGAVAASALLVVNHLDSKVENGTNIALAQTTINSTNSIDADARKVINYQGQVFNPVNGAPYVNTGLNFSFRLYNNPTGTSLVFQEDQFITTNLDGFFNTSFGSGIGNVYDIFNGQELYLRVYINGEELAPLQPVTFVPYALWSEHAHHLDDYDADDFPKIVAYGVINANGSRKSGERFNSSLGTVAGAQVYIIDLQGVSNHTIDQYTTIVTPACANPVITGIGSSEGDLIVDMWNQNGARVTCTFQFMTLTK